MDLAGEGVLQLSRNIKSIEYWLRFRIDLHFIGGALGDFGDHFAHALISFGTIDHNTFDILGEKITNRSFDEIRFLENATCRGLLLNALLDLAPFVEQ